MNGFNVAEEGHTILVLAPVDISGGKTGQRFSMKNHKHASIILALGVIGTSKPTAILVKKCTDVSGGTATAIGYRYYQSRSGSTSQDLYSPGAVADSGGVLAATLSKIASQMLVIELDAEELGDGYPYCEVSITDSGNTTLASIVAILSGSRQSYEGGGPTATA